MFSQFLHTLPLLYFGMVVYCLCFILVINYTLAFVDKSPDVERYESVDIRLRWLIVLLCSMGIALVPGYNMYYVLRNIAYA